MEPPMNNDRNISRTLAKGMFRVIGLKTNIFLKPGVGGSITTRFCMCPSGSHGRRTPSLLRCHLQNILREMMSWIHWWSHQHWVWQDLISSIFHVGMRIWTLDLRGARGVVQLCSTPKWPMILTRDSEWLPFLQCLSTDTTGLKAMKPGSLILSLMGELRPTLLSTNYGWRP
jgi:hypothetical protein